MNRILRRKVRRDPRRQRSQIIVVVGMVFLGVVLFTANIDAAHNLDSSYKSLYDRLDTDAVVLEQHAADHFHLGPGDTLEIWQVDHWRTVRIVGVAASGEYLFPARSRTEVFTVPSDFAVVFVPNSMAREIAPHGGRRLAVRIDGRDPRQVAAVLAAAKAAGATGAHDLAHQPSNLALQSDVQEFASMSYLFPVLVPGAAGMATFVLLNRLVRQERTPIGMMVADGVETSTIMWHYVAHALIASLAGGRFLACWPGLCSAAG